MEMKFSIEKIPIPTPACSFAKVPEIEFASVICMNDWPTLPKIKKQAIPMTAMPVKVESSPKQTSSKPDARKNRYAFPFRSASFPPTLPGP